MTQTESLENYMDVALVAIDSIKVENRFRAELGDLSDLKASLKLLGLLQPVGVTKDNRLIYGGRRLQSAKELGWHVIPARICDYDNLKAELAEHEENLQRENLRWDLEVKSRARVVELYEALGILAKHGGDRKSMLSETTLKTRSDVAKQLGLTGKHGRIQLHKDIQLAHAIEEMPELADQPTKKAALNKLRSTKTIEALTEKTNQDAEKHLPEGLKIQNGDFRELGKDIEDNSVDLIFTDPPYDRESIPLYKDLAVFASRVLKPGGSIITYIGQYVMPEILDLFKNASELKYFWILAVKHTGGASRFHDKQIMVRWKPLLWYVKGDKRALPQNMNDFIESEPPVKGYHEWAQSEVEAEYVIENLTVENAIILDPFMGSGTTGLAALKIKRRFIGFEKNPEKFKVAKKRFEQL